MKTPEQTSTTLNWRQSLLWIAASVACFHGAYASPRQDVAAGLIFGYALALVRLVDQPNARRAFYFGLTAGVLCYAPQLFFLFKIFNVAAVVLWLVLAFWTGLFAALACGCIRRWGKSRAAWLIPILWTGVEFFRSELYPLKFSWLSPGYLSPAGSSVIGMYGFGLMIMAAAALGPVVIRNFRNKITSFRGLALLVVFAIGAALPLPAGSKRHQKAVSITGIQLEFPSPNILPRMLDQALTKHPHTQIFVLSEYTLDGPVPDGLKAWCRQHERYLVVGGKDPVGTDQYYNTAFVVGPNGDIVFKQVKSVPIQFFKDGLPAPSQKLWESPWGKIGICICYDLSYTRVTDELVRQGAQLLIVPTMDVEDWGRREHQLHAMVAPVRAAEYGLPIFRLASSGISQAVDQHGRVWAHTSVPGLGEIISTSLPMASLGTLPIDRVLASLCTLISAVTFVCCCRSVSSPWRRENSRSPRDRTAPRHFEQAT